MKKEKYHQHFYLNNEPERVDFTSRQMYGPTFSTKARVRQTHAQLLENQMRAIWAKVEADTRVAKENDRAHAITTDSGTYIAFESAPDYDLKIQSLENRREGIRLLNTFSREVNGHSIKYATVFVPANKKDYFLKKIEKYATSEPSEKGRYKNQDFIESIEAIKLAYWDSLWICNADEKPSESPVWCEVWLRADNAVVKNMDEQIAQDFFEICKNINLEYRDSVLVFPERYVCLVKANREQLQQLLDLTIQIAAFRRAEETTSFFLEQCKTEQQEWAQELLERIQYDDTNTSVCILDTGVNNKNVLLAPFISDDDVHTINDLWGTYDHDGHGTAMCGIATFFDLKKLLESQEKINISHNLESVKLIPPAGENRPDLYGELTRQATYEAEIGHPDRKRILCMAVTSDVYNTKNGTPTSWSAEIDNITSGAHDNKQRLMIISAGNTDTLVPHEFPEHNMMTSVHSPGQAWNALTVGAYTSLSTITDDDLHDYIPLSLCGDMSPYTTTSLSWSDEWPIKPEIVCEGGNKATTEEFCTGCEDLSLLTTSFDVQNRIFTSICATSSASAQAANIAAKICSKYQDLWPETIRALIINSADWTPQMIRRFHAEENTKKNRKNMLRCYGYGVPSLEKAEWSLDNDIKMIIQSELQPFIQRKNDVKLNEMHIHKLPWPKDMLRDLGNTPIKMKVTLSYFIEPGPGEVGWKDRYRYPSALLRFDVNNKDEDEDSFKKRINVAMRGEKGDKGDGTSGSDRWYLGPQTRTMGSLHSDIWEGNAVDFCDCNFIGIYPATGWWKTRKYLGQFNRKLRYSLVVSLYTPDTNIDLYTPIKIQIAPEIAIRTSST